MSPRHHLTDFEPDEEWKTQLNARIQLSLVSLINEAKQSQLTELRRGAGIANPETRQRLQEEYKAATAKIKLMAAEHYEAELEKERKQRHWIAGEPIGPEWEKLLAAEQQDILNSIMQTQRQTPPIDVTTISAQSTSTPPSPFPRLRTPESTLTCAPETGILSPYRRSRRRETEPPITVTDPLPPSVPPPRHRSEGRLTTPSHNRSDEQHPPTRRTNGWSSSSSSLTAIRPKRQPYPRSPLSSVRLDDGDDDGEDGEDEEDKEYDFGQDDSFAILHRDSDSSDDTDDSHVWVRAPANGDALLTTELRRWLARATVRATLLKEEEVRRKDEEARLRAEELGRKEAKVVRMAEETRRIEEEAKQKAEEVRRREDAVIQREAEIKGKLWEVTKREQDVRRLNEDGRRFAEELSRKEAEAMRITEEARRKGEELAKKESQVDAREKAVSEREQDAKKVVDNAKRFEELAKRKENEAKKLEQDLDLQIKAIEVNNLEQKAKEHATRLDDEAKRKIIELEKDVERKLTGAKKIEEAARRKETEVKNKEEAVRKREERLKQEFANAKQLRQEVETLAQETGEKNDKLLQFAEDLLMREKEIQRREEKAHCAGSSTEDVISMQYAITSTLVRTPSMLSSNVSISDRKQYFQEYPISISNRLARVPSNKSSQLSVTAMEAFYQETQQLLQDPQQPHFGMQNSDVHSQSHSESSIFRDQSRGSPPRDTATPRPRYSAS